MEQSRGQKNAIFLDGLSQMFSSLIPLEDLEVSELFEVLYDDYFCVDFIDSKTYLNSTIYINPQTYKKEDGKEKSFWHLTSREQSYQVKEGKKTVPRKERLPDFARAERLEWVKLIIENHTDPQIKLFYRKETTDKKPIRLYLWLYQKDFVVILQKLGANDSFLVTSFYITYDDKRDEYQERFEKYVNKKDGDLVGCEWF